MEIAILIFITVFSIWMILGYFLYRFGFKRGYAKHKRITKE
jgi:uncharacterized protein YneF (UPF0154 family)